MVLNIKSLYKQVQDKKLFEGIDLVVHANEKIALIGPNGSGKTTLIRCILGVEDFEGSIEIKEGIKINNFFHFCAGTAKICRYIFAV